MAGQQQRRGVSGSEPELFVTKQTAHAYFSNEPGEKDHLEELANTIKEISVFRKKAAWGLSRLQYRHHVSMFLCW